MRRLGAALLVAIATLLTTLPASAAGVTCEGYAPEDHYCEMSFVADSTDLEISAVMGPRPPGIPYAGALVARISYGDDGAFFVCHSAVTAAGCFGSVSPVEPGQDVTLTAIAPAVGYWRVSVATS